MRIVNKIITYVELGASYAIASDIQYRYETGEQCIHVPLSTLCDVGTKVFKNGPYVDEAGETETRFILDVETTFKGAKWIESATDGRIKIDLNTNMMSLRVEDCYEFYKERSINQLVKQFKSKK